MKLNIQAFKKIDKIRQKYGLFIVLLHGSRLTGKVHSKSDLDLAILRKDIKSEISYSELNAEFIRLFDFMDIDITDLTTADPLLLYAITRNSKLLSGNIKVYDKLLLKAFQKYNDYLPFLRDEEVFIKKTINKYVSA